MACRTDSAFLSFEVWGAVDNKELNLRIANVAAFASVATGASKIALAGGLDGDLPTAAGAYAAYIGDLEFMTAAEFNAAIDRLGPNVYHSVDASMRRTTQYMTESWAGYLDSRSGRCLCLCDDPPGRCPCGKSSNVFAQPFGMFYNERSGDDRVGFDADTSGIQLLADRWIADDVIAGVGFGYGYTGVGFDDDYGRAELNVFRVGPYLSICEDTWFLDTIASYGRHDNQVDRNTIYNGTYDGAYGCNNVSLYAAIGKNYRQARA